ncbi:replicative DNA helicase [Merismopedia glauca]|uniref:Replicative DNA helicase n=1 Tax=Merismopedia glauca CCAP 1448/3 TaxID=1296344 RepID=A0A2T1C2G3_9CYAN|nr:replicative DNA helicase [Merismopedia glauca]PSB02394.1 replicative DNA helicase [Merismopedia glauca CCAP 1448/3]
MTSAYQHQNPTEFFSTPALPPQNIDAEEGILGGILLDPNAISRIASILTPEMFYISSHQQLYRAASTLYQQCQPTDLMHIATWLRDRQLLEQIGGTAKIAQLIERTVSAVNIDALAHLVKDKYIRRQIIATGNQIALLGYETSAELAQCQAEAERLVYTIGAKNTKIDEGAYPVGDALMELYSQWERADEPPLLPTGLYDLDALIGGLRRGDLTIIAGRPSMGKTQVGVYLAHQVAVVKKQPVVFFSAEMSRDKLLCRFVAHVSGLDASRLLNHKILDSEWHSLAQAVGLLSQSQLRIDSTTNPTISHMRGQLQKTLSEAGSVGLVVLDYLQLLGNSSANRVQELDEIAKGCKALAKEFDVPFIALSQLNRGVEARNNKRPMMSDIRDSGAIEQTADVVLLLYRDEYYHSDTSDRALMEIAVGKNRDGETGIAKLLFDPKVSGFKNLARGGEK